MRAASAANFAEQRAFLRRRAAELAAALDDRDESVLDEARATIETLQSQREFDLLERLADAIRSLGVEGRATILLGQALIEQGRSRLAADVLGGLLAELDDDDPDVVNAGCVLGRAWKQLYFDEADHRSPRAELALRRSMCAYASAYDRSDHTSTYAGINLLALLFHVERLALTVEHASCVAEVAAMVEKHLAGQQKECRNPWFHADMAELAIVRGSLEEMRDHVRAYVAAPTTDAFMLYGTIRQFEELWCLNECGAIGSETLDALRAATLDRAGGYVELTAQSMERVRDPAPSRTEQVILGRDGQMTHRVLATAAQRGLSVAAIERDGFGRIASGFVVRGGDVLEHLGDMPCLLTNWHTIGDDASVVPALDEYQAVFEVPPPSKTVPLVELLWFSPAGLLDAALIRLDAEDLPPPLPIGRNLPAADGHQRVYVVGHPLGRELTYSLQDNRLLEHEGPTGGTPVDAAVRKLHYRAATEKGSSGSPVFNAGWKVIALHRGGGSMQRLNGRSGEWLANEGVWIQSIIEAARAHARAGAKD